MKVTRTVSKISVTGPTTLSENLPATSLGRLCSGIRRERGREEDLDVHGAGTKMLRSCQSWKDMEKTAQSKESAGRVSLMVYTPLERKT